MSEAQLFDTTPFEVPPVVTAGMGHDAARTARRRALIAKGVHPATLLTLLPGNKTCGDCAHLWNKNMNNFSGWKCTQAATSGTHGPDMRKSWPACTAFKPLENTTGGDE